MYKVAIITASDKGYAGEREDKSGSVIEEIVTAHELEVTGKVILPDAMIANSLQYTPKAMLSRGIAGIRENTLIVNLPGSPKAVRENLEYAIDAIIHGVKILKGDDAECARK